MPVLSVRNLDKSFIERALFKGVTFDIEKGDKVGTISFTLNDEEIASFDILAADDVEKKSFSSIFSLLWQALIQP